MNIELRLKKLKEYREEMLNRHDYLKSEYGGLESCKDLNFDSQRSEINRYCDFWELGNADMDQLIGDVMWCFDKSCVHPDGDQSQCQVKRFNEWRERTNAHQIRERQWLGMISDWNQTVRNRK